MGRPGEPDRALPHTGGDPSRALTAPSTPPSATAAPSWPSSATLPGGLPSAALLAVLPNGEFLAIGFAVNLTTLGTTALILTRYFQ